MTAGVTQKTWERPFHIENHITRRHYMYGNGSISPVQLFFENFFARVNVGNNTEDSGYANVPDFCNRAPTQGFSSFLENIALHALSVFWHPAWEWHIKFTQMHPKYQTTVGWERNLSQVQVQKMGWEIGPPGYERCSIEYETGKIVSLLYTSTKHCTSWLINTIEHNVQQTDPFLSPRRWYERAITRGRPCILGWRSFCNNYKLPGHMKVRACDTLNGSKPRSDGEQCAKAF